MFVGLGSNPVNDEEKTVCVPFTKFCPANTMPIVYPIELP
jgi:hypothetical protein